MTTNGIDMETMSEIMQALNHYYELETCFTQIDASQEEQLNLYFKSNRHKWRDVNLHVLKQMWGSTACGWGGMGGSMMTESYTVIIEAYNAVFVYYNGKIAYVAWKDEVMVKYIEANWHGLPAYFNTSALNIIYKNMNRR